ncbi:MULTISPECIES: hypothetical protein [Bacillati]|uniref:hypothetical protein n=1 Tax=Bacillati TaxID=1783272 RepID=UPI0007EB72AA|nr:MULTISPECIES: hypothetical protein [Terrabacteria group]OBA45710.1 hypothetical protein A5728_00310 [Kocuria sp. ICS0012]
MAEQRESEKRWARVEDEIDRDTETVALNVEIPKSLKREIAIEKARTGEKYKDLTVRVWREYLRRQYTSAEKE